MPVVRRSSRAVGRREPDLDGVVLLHGRGRAASLHPPGASSGRQPRLRVRRGRRDPGAVQLRRRASRPEGFWTNTIFSDRIFLEAQLPAQATATELGSAILLVGAVVHLEHPSFAPSAAQKALHAPEVRQLLHRPQLRVDRRVSERGPGHEGDRAAHVRGRGLVLRLHGRPDEHDERKLRAVPPDREPLLLERCFGRPRSRPSGSTGRRPATAPSRTRTSFRARSARRCSRRARRRRATSRSSSSCEDPPADSVLLGWTTADVSHWPAAHALPAELRQREPDDLHAGADRRLARRRCAPTRPGAPFSTRRTSRAASGGGSSGSPLYLEDLRVVGQEFGELRHQPRATTATS